MNVRSGLDVINEAAKAACIHVDEQIPISEEVFQQLGIPMVVRCTGCDMTMATPAALIAPDGTTWCGGCAGVES